MTADIEQTLANVFTLLLGKPLRPEDVVEKDSEPNWDSLKHIEIVMTVEDACAVVFAPEDIPGLTSMALFAAKIRELEAISR